MRKASFNSDLEPQPDGLRCGFWTYEIQRCARIFIQRENMAYDNFFSPQAARVDSTFHYFENCDCKIFEQKVRIQ